MVRHFACHEVHSMSDRVVFIYCNLTATNFILIKVSFFDLLLHIKSPDFHLYYLKRSVYWIRCHGSTLLALILCNYLVERTRLKWVALEALGRLSFLFGRIRVMIVKDKQGLSFVTVVLQMKRSREKWTFTSVRSKSSIICLFCDSKVPIIFMCVCHYKDTK